MKSEKLIVLVVVVIVALIVISGAFYTVDETQQVVITQFGDPVGEPIRDAGLYMKIPFVQKVNVFEERLLAWNGSPTQVPTEDKKFIWVDTTARWRIVEPLKFLEAVGNERIALARLDDIIDSAVRDRITSYVLYEVVRNTNREFTTTELGVQAGEEVGTVELGREKLSRMILEDAGRIVPQFGMELVDVRIKRLNYVDQVREKVYARMISERKRVAAVLRSEGQGKQAEIEGMREKELKTITSEAYRQAQEIQGKADAEATETYAGAYDRDPEFYAFLKTLETYRKGLDEETTLLLTPESEFFRYLKSIEVSE